MIVDLVEAEEALRSVTFVWNEGGCLDRVQILGDWEIVGYSTRAVIRRPGGSVVYKVADPREPECEDGWFRGMEQNVREEGMAGRLRDVVPVPDVLLVTPEVLAMGFVQAASPVPEDAWDALDTVSAEVYCLGVEDSFSDNFVWDGERWWLVDLGV